MLVQAKDHLYLQCQKKRKRTQTSLQCVSANNYCSCLSILTTYWIIMVTSDFNKMGRSWIRRKKLEGRNRFCWMVQWGGGGSDACADQGPPLSLVPEERKHTNTRIPRKENILCNVCLRTICTNVTVVVRFSDLLIILVIITNVHALGQWAVKS